MPTAAARKLVARGYLATSDDGIFTSSDGAASWARASSGLIAGNVIALAADPTTMGRPYAVVAVSPPYPQVEHVVVSMQWTLKRGAATPDGDRGDPLASDTYALCVYSAGRLWSSTTVPPGGACDGRPCWTPTSRGFDYRDRELTPDGVRQLRLRTAGADGPTTVRVDARGATLELDSPSTLSGTLTVQLVRSGGDACWESVYSAPFAKQTANKFSAASD